MPGPIKYLAFGLIVIVALGFLGGIFLAGYYTLWIDGAPRPTQMPKFVADFVTSAGAVLSTNLGAALGIRTMTGRWHVSRGPNPSDTLRIYAAYFYAGSLVIALVLWGLAGFSSQPSEMVAVLPELTRTLMGVAVGTLAVMLGVPQLTNES